MSLSFLTYKPDNKFVVKGQPFRFRFLKQKRISTSEEPTTLDDLCWRLQHNELRHLKIGFGEENDDHLTSKRNALQLERALRHNTSVRSVSIGWRHSHREALFIVLRAVGKYTRLQSLQLILDDWVPESLLKTVIHNQASHLEVLDIRSVQVLRRTALGRLCCEIADPPGPNDSERSNGTASTSASSQSGSSRASSSSKRRSKKSQKSMVDRYNCTTCDHSVISRVLVQLRGSYLPRLRHLQMQDVELHDAQAVMLADFLHIRGGIQELVLRGNRSLGPRGVAILCQAPVTDKLDLSLCDMNPETAAALAPALAARRMPLGELLVCGNYRMGTEALMSLFQPPVCDALKGIDVSYCDINDHRATALLNAMTASLTDKSQLRKLVVHGSFVSSAADGWSHLLQKNLSSLRVIHMNDPHAPKLWTLPQLEALVEGLRQNYELEDLTFDSMKTTDHKEVLAEIEFHLRLNRAGRRILLQRGENENMDFFDVLARAGDDLNVTYWLVRNSANAFHRPNN